MNHDYFFSFTGIGFNWGISCSVYFLIKFFHRKENYLLYLALLNFFHSVYTLFNEPAFFNALSFTAQTVEQLRSVSICSVVLFFYLFFIDFLALRKYHWVRLVLLCGTFYMVLVITCRIFQYQFPFFGDLYEHFLKKVFLYMDLLMFSSLFVYLLRAQKKYHYYILAGICGIMVFAALNFFREQWGIPLSKSFLRQAELMVGISFFFLAIVKKEKEQLEEHEQVKTALLQRELERQAEVINERTRISQDMHDELGAGISAIKLRLEFLKRSIDDGNKDADISELLEITEKMNQSMREMIWSLDHDHDNLQSFVNYLSRYGQAFFSKTAINYRFAERHIEGDSVIRATTRRELLLCVKEAMNNIVKHSHATQATLSVIQQGREVVIYVEDDGIGIRSDNQSGFGMANMEARMRKLQGTMTIQSLPRSCTLCFRINLDVQ